MKRKFSSIWRVAIAMVLVLSLSLVMAAPAAASPDLNEVTITVNPPTGSAPAEYMVDFFVHTGLTDDYNCVVVEFPTGTTVPGTIATTNVEIYDKTEPTVAQEPSAVVVDTLVTKTGMAYRVRVYMPSAGLGIKAFHYGCVKFLLASGIENPAANEEEIFYAWVYSDEEPEPVQAEYVIYETVPIDVYLKYQIPPVECGYVVDTLVESFLTIGEALDFVDDLYTSGVEHKFTVVGAVTTYDYGDMFISGGAGSWTDHPAIFDRLWFTDITSTEAESFTVTYNKSDGTSASSIITVPDATDLDTGLDVVDVVSVTGGDPGATAGYQTTFNLTGDVYNATAGDYGDWGITTAGWTDGTSIGEALTLTVTTTLPTTNKFVQSKFNVR